MELEGKNILLTGASGGIGRQLCLQLEKAGANLIITARTKDSIEDILFKNGSIHFVQADLQEEEDTHFLYSETKSKFKHLDILISACGINEMQLIEAQSCASISKIINTNLTSNIFLTKQFIPLLKRSDQKSFLLFVGSMLGAIGLPGSSVYCASKFGLRGFAESMSRELSTDNIHVCYIAPRATKTNMNTKAMNELNQALKNKVDQPEWVAQQIIRSIQHDKKEVYLGYPETFFAYLNMLVPSLVDKFISKQTPIISQHLKQS